MAEINLNETGPLRLVIFPWLAFGHMHPLLELSKLLASRGHQITFISTPRNIQRLPRIPSHLSPNITFVPLKLPHIEPLPETAEATTDIPQEHVQYLEKAFDGLATPFSAFLESVCSDARTRPDWCVMDLHHHWLPKMAKRFYIPCALFSVMPAPSLAFFQAPTEELQASRNLIEHFITPPSWIPFRSNLAFRYHEAWWTVDSCQANTSGISVGQRAQSSFDGNDFICVRTCTELDSKWLDLLPGLYKKDTVPVGLLPPDQSEHEIRDTEFDLVEWLDNHKAKSVLYVALRSEAALRTDLLHELALGLERSKVPFLWALRKRTGTNSDAIDLLPAGFEDRVKNFGRVALGWVPQISVLAHYSVGGFLTHCGPSSVIESMRFGHPLIMLPLIADQPLIARVLEERGVGVELPRDEKTGDFDREDVAGVVRRVMVEEEGKVIRCNAEQIGTAYTDKVSQEKHIDGFIKRLRKSKIEST